NTGEWRGGGRHPDIPKEDTCQKINLSPEDRARQEQSRNAAFHRLGRKIGVFGSYPLMGEGFGEYFLPPPLPNWNNVIAKESGSPNISISSPAHQRAALSRWA